MSILDQPGSRHRRGRAAQPRAPHDRPAYQISPVRSRSSHRWDRFALGGMVSGGCLFGASATAMGSPLAPGLWAAMGVLCGLLTAGYGLRAAEGLMRLASKARAVRIATEDRLVNAGSKAA